MTKSKDKSGCEHTLYVAWIAVKYVDIQVENEQNICIYCKASWLIFTKIKKKTMLGYLFIF